MKIRAFAAFMACSLAAVACNDVPVRSLTSSYQVQIQELRDRGKPAKLDILWVVDDSPSMCQEQQSLVSSFKAFLEIFQKYTAIDMQLAVTTTNVCAKGKPGAIRGKFVYNPATTLPIDCMEKQAIPCRNDQQCQQYTPTNPPDALHPVGALPDPASWKCDLVNAGEDWTCDLPQAIKDQGGTDLYPDGDYLFTFRSKCKYQCAKDVDPGKCARVFGQPDGCSTDAPTGAQASMCQSGTCDSSACVSNTDLAGTVDCATRCRGQECAAVCSEFLSDAAQCKARCDAGSCVDVCDAVSKTQSCDNICKSDWTCQEKCEDVLHDAGNCQAACAQPTAAECRTECGNRFTNQEFLCFLACDGAYSCPDRCIARFGQPTYRCLVPSGGTGGCLLPPATGACPGVAVGPKILNNTVADQWLKEWISGGWAGSPDFDPAWKTLPTGDSTDDYNAREIARTAVFEQIFKCMATVGATQDQQCSLQEQGLRAALLALDPDGENGDQARSFLREDAYLLIITIGDEDDCSADEFVKGKDAKGNDVYDNLVPAELYPYCECLRDTDGCNAQGECDRSACSSNRFDMNPSKHCVLYPVSQVMNSLRSLKADPAQVVFATITGQIIPGSPTSPSNDPAKIQSRFFDCRCKTSTPDVLRSSTYACSGASGQADLGIRMASVAKAFGLGRFGQLSNICADEGIRPSLESIAQLVIPLLTQVCLPRPLEWSCQGKCEDLFGDRDSCQQACGATDCFKTCQDRFQGRPGCADICGSGEFVEVFKYDAKGKCAKVDASGNCLPLTFAPNPSADGDYFLVQGSPSCPLFDSTLGERIENALQFKVPLEYSDRIEIVYRVGAFACQDRCNRVFKNAAACDDLCNGTTEACIDTCTKSAAASRCAYVCSTTSVDCIERCTANGTSNCTTICKN